MRVAAATSEVLVVVICGRRCAIPMERVAAVRLYAAETPMPGLPRCVRGVVEREGTPVHVIDTAQRLGHGRSNPAGRACIIFFEDVEHCGAAALLVDEVEHIVSRTDVNDGPSFIPRDLVAATVSDNDEPLPLLNIDRFFDLKLAESA